MRAWSIGVVGFGVAGGAVATLLAKQGHQVTLLERAPVLGPVGAGFMLQPAGQEVLRQLGLLEAVAAQSAPIRGLRARTACGCPLANLRFHDTPALGVHRGVLFQLLYDSARAAGVKILTSAEITASDGPLGQVFARAVDGVTHGPFDFLIATDGSRSRLRFELNPSSRAVDYQFGALWGTGRCSTVTDHVQQATRGSRRLTGLVPVGSGRATFFWGLHRRELAGIRARPFSAWSKEVITLIPEAEETLIDLSSHEAMVFAGYLHEFPRRIHDKRMILIGDAAHAMSPHLGQGANLALLDAECLARHLAQQSEVAAAFHSHQEERRGQTRFYSLLSRWLSPTFQSELDWLGWMRDLGLPVLQSIPWFRRQMELAVAGKKRGFFHRWWR